MKLIHMSDLHIGKRVNGFSMVEDQRYILGEILRLTKEEKPDAAVIAGDVYDKSVPPAEAVELLDDFLCGLAELTPHIFIISGNHDSPERLAFGSRLMTGSGIHLSPVFDGKVTPVTLSDSYGEVDVFMLPFIKPAHARRAFPEKEEDIATYTDAVKAAIDNMDIDDSRRNVLITHQFVTGAVRSDSEEMTISAGGTDNVDADVMEVFDYVALGHIHGPQSMTQRIRYCGTPLKYSFSEAKHEKSLTVAELREKGDLTIRTLPLVPLRDMAELRGSYSQLTDRSFYDGTSYRDDYVHITLTDEEDVPEALARLRVIYGNLMKLDYDNSRTRNEARVEGAPQSAEKQPLELFADFYEIQNGSPMSEEQRKLVGELIEEIWEVKG